MGCCLSKTQDFNPNPSASSQFQSSAHQPLQDSNSHPLRGPLSPVFEEESVKEVLSETPKPKSKPQEQLIPIPLQEEKNISTSTKIEEEKQILSPVKIPEEKRVFESVNNVAVSEDFSEVSEICSLSGSISTTVTERKDDEEGEVSQPRVHRSPAKRIRKRPIPGEFVSRHDRGSKSPARRLNASPVRRNDATNQEMGTRRKIAENNRARRESIERTTRRSRSPATRTNTGATNRAAIGRSPSKRAVAPRSPARGVAAKPSPPEKVEQKTGKEGNETNESIENPLVSMECFIFL